jgi:hypothetical protein
MYDAHSVRGLVSKAVVRGFLNTVLCLYKVIQEVCGHALSCWKQMPLVSSPHNYHLMVSLKLSFRNFQHVLLFTVDPFCRKYICPIKQST